LGQLWQVMTPLLNAAVYYLIFGLLLGTSKGIDNFIAFLVTGIFIFTFTQSSVMSGVRAVAGNLGLIRALHFPRASMPVALTLMQLQQLMMSMFVLVAIVLMTGETPRLSWLLAVPALLTQWVFNTGLAMIVVAFVATLFIREVPLRQTAHVAAGRSRGEGVKDAETAV